MIIRTGAFILLAVVSFYDLRKKEIPVWSIATAACLAVLSLITLLCTGDAEGTGVSAAAGAVLPGVLLLVTGLISAQAVGYGDGLLAGCIGPVFGLRLMTGGLLLAFFFSAVVSVVLLAFKKADRKTRIPFVPFLTAAMGVVSVVQI